MDYCASLHNHGSELDTWSGFSPFFPPESKRRKMHRENFSWTAQGTLHLLDCNNKIPKNDWNSNLAMANSRDLRKNDLFNHVLLFGFHLRIGHDGVKRFWNVLFTCPNFMEIEGDVVRDKLEGWLLKKALLLSAVDSLKSSASNNDSTQIHLRIIWRTYIIETIYAN